MKRRDFVAALAGGAVGFPLIARAQQASKPVIGFLGTSTPSTSRERTDAFVQRLSELGWVEGRTVAIEYRWAEGRAEGLAAFAAELVRLKVDVIVTGGAAAVSAVEHATTTIPIVFGVASDPVASGLVASLSRPGGNATGLSFEGPDLASKRLELAREMVPGLHSLGVMANTASPGSILELRAVQAAAATVRLDIEPVELRRAEDIGPAVAALKDRAQALYVCADPLVNSNRPGIIALAQDARLPTIFSERENVDAGGLFSYGPNTPDLFRRAAEIVDKILRGAKPADIPVEQPTKFELVINLKTAQALGIVVPQSLLAKADETIE